MLTRECRRNAARDVLARSSLRSRRIGQRDVAQWRKLLVRWCVSRSRVSLFWKRIKKSEVPLRLLLSPDVSSFVFPTVNFRSRPYPCDRTIGFRERLFHTRASVLTYTWTDNTKNKNTQMERPFVFHGAAGCFCRGQAFRQERILSRPGTSSLPLSSVTSTLNRKKQIIPSFVCASECSL